MLLMQTFSFFTQQAVAVELHKSSQPNNANITRAVTYTPPRQSSLNFGPDSSTINSGSSGFGIGSQGDGALSATLISFGARAADASLRRGSLFGSGDQRRLI